MSGPFLLVSAPDENRVYSYFTGAKPLVRGPDIPCAKVTLRAGDCVSGRYVTDMGSNSFVRLESIESLAEMTVQRYRVDTPMLGGQTILDQGDNLFVRVQNAMAPNSLSLRAPT